MSKPNLISARVSDDVLAKIDRLAAARDRSRAWIIAHLLEQAATKETEFLDFVQVGLDDLAAGRVVSQEDMEAWFKDRKSARRAQIAAE
jgi:predicted transcriptional regulator